MPGKASLTRSRKEDYFEYFKNGIKTGPRFRAGTSRTDYAAHGLGVPLFYI